eukprot:jgi/Chrpa1/533/Chrysochromulina_OHIO_Genome00010341-RA
MDPPTGAVPRTAAKAKSAATLTVSVEDMEQLTRSVTQAYVLGTSRTDQQVHALLLKRARQTGHAAQTLWMRGSTDAAIRLHIVFRDRSGSLGTLSTIISQYGGNIIGVSAHTTNDGFGLSVIAASNMPTDLRAIDAHIRSALTPQQPPYPGSGEATSSAVCRPASDDAASDDSSRGLLSSQPKARRKRCVIFGAPFRFPFPVSSTPSTAKHTLPSALATPFPASSSRGAPSLLPAAALLPGGLTSNPPGTGAGVSGVAGAAMATPISSLGAGGTATPAWPSLPASACMMPMLNSMSASACGGLPTATASPLYRTASFGTSFRQVPGACCGPSASSHAAVAGASTNSLVVGLGSAIPVGAGAVPVGPMGSAMPMKTPVILGTNGAAAIASADPEIKAVPLQTAELILLGEVGSGSGSSVWRGRVAGLDVAVKVLKTTPGTSNKDALRGFVQEARILSQLCHPSICMLYGTCMQLSSPALVFEFMAGGSLFDLLHNSPAELFPSTLSRIALEVASGVAYLHQQEVIHRDVKSANVLLDADLHAKVSDFGISTTFGPEHTAETGTYRSMAPEVLTHHPYNEMCDVFSFGVLLWEIGHIEIPFGSDSFLQAAFAVAVERKRPPVALPPPLGALAPLIQACWQHEPSDRPPMSRVLTELQAIEAQIRQLEERHAGGGTCMRSAIRSLRAGPMPAQRLPSAEPVQAPQAPPSAQ